MIDKQLFHEFQKRIFMRQPFMSFPLKDEAEVSRAQRILDSLLPLAEIEVTPRLFVSGLGIKNASSIESGHISINKGLMTSDGAVALVLAHELAHVKKQHTTQTVESFLNAVGAHPVSTLTYSLFEEELTDVLSSFAYSAHQSDLFDSQEGEADALGVEWALSAGYNPDEVKDAFGVLLRPHRGPQLVDEWLERNRRAA